MFPTLTHPTLIRTDDEAKNLFGSYDEVLPYLRMVRFLSSSVFGLWEPADLFIGTVVDGVQEPQGLKGYRPIDYRWMIRR